jgi:hypothetical protein
MRRKKIFTIIVIVISAVVILLLAGGLILSRYIENKISDSYIRGYHITSKDVTVNLIARSVKIESILVTDSVPGERQLQIPEIRVQGISYYNLIFKKRYKIKNIRINGPELFYLSQHDTTSVPKEKPNELRLLINKLEVNNLKITMLYPDSSNGDTLLNTNLDLELWDLSAGDSTGNFRYKNIGIDRIALYIENALYYFPDKLYRLKTDVAEYDSKDSLFTIKKLEILTNFSRYGLGKYAKTQQSWLHLTLDAIALNQIDPGRLIKDTTLSFNTLNISFLNALAFKDRRLPFPQKPDTKLPMAMIDGFPFKLHCDSLNIADGYIEYTDRAPNSSDEGKIRFEHLQAHAENLSNTKDLIYGKTIMHASASVMGKTMLDADFVFPNVKYPEPYTATGYLNPVSMKHFNAILLQAAGAKINAGEIKNLWFNFSYNNDISHGSMIFEYEGLNVDLMDRKEMEKKGIPSLLMNAFVVKKDNVRGEKSFKEGTISFERDKKKAIFNYWWKSVMSGFISTVAPG